jgi:hypothetical protein
MEQALPAAMIVGTLVDMATLLNANGDVVSAMLITNFGRKVAFKHVDYIIYRRKFYQTKQPFVTERVYRQLLKYYFSAFFNYYVINK